MSSAKEIAHYLRDCKWFAGVHPSDTLPDLGRYTRAAQSLQTTNSTAAHPRACGALGCHPYAKRVPAARVHGSVWVPSLPFLPARRRLPINAPPCIATGTTCSGRTSITPAPAR